MPSASSGGGAQWILYLYPSESYILAITISLFLITWAVTALRFLARRLRRLSLMTDDWLTLPAFMSVAGCGAVLIAASTNNAIVYNLPYNSLYDFGAEPKLAVQPDLKLYHQLYTVYQWLQIVALGTSKLSLLCLYRRVFFHKNTTYSRVNLSAVVFTALWIVAFLLATLFQCGTDFSTLFGLSGLNKTCRATSPINLALAISNLVLYAVVAGIPIPLLYGLETSWEQKLGIFGAYVLGGLAISGGVVRLIAAAETTSWVVGWTLCEVSVSAIFANIPVAACLFSTPVKPNIFFSCCSGQGRRNRRRAERGLILTWGSEQRAQSPAAQDLEREKEERRLTEARIARERQQGLRRPNQRPSISEPVLPMSEQGRRVITTIDTGGRHEPAFAEMLVRPLLQQHEQRPPWESSQSPQIYELPDELVLVPREYYNAAEDERADLVPRQIGRTSSRVSHGHHQSASSVAGPSPLTPRQRQQITDGAQRQADWKPSPMDDQQPVNPFRSPKTGQSPRVQWSPIVATEIPPSSWSMRTDVSPRTRTRRNSRTAQSPRVQQSVQMPPPVATTIRSPRHQQVGSMAPDLRSAPPSPIVGLLQQEQEQEQLRQQQRELRQSSQRALRIQVPESRYMIMPAKTPPRTSRQLSVSTGKTPPLQHKSPASSRRPSQGTISRESLDRELPPLPPLPEKLERLRAAASPVAAQQQRTPELRQQTLPPRTSSTAERRATIWPEVQSSPQASQSPTTAQLPRAPPGSPAARASVQGRAGGNVTTEARQDADRLETRIARDMKVAYTANPGLPRAAAESTWFDSRSSTDSEDLMPWHRFVADRRFGQPGAPPKGEFTNSSRLR